MCLFCFLNIMGKMKSWHKRFLWTWDFMSQNHTLPSGLKLIINHTIQWSGLRYMAGFQDVANMPTGIILVMDQCHHLSSSYQRDPTCCKPQPYLSVLLGIDCLLPSLPKQLLIYKQIPLLFCLRINWIVIEMCIQSKMKCSGPLIKENASLI